MIMTGKILDMCASAYVQCYRSQFKKYTWAVDYAEKLIQSDPRAGLLFIFEILNICHNDQEIEYVSAGLLEDLLDRDLSAVKSEIKLAAQKNKTLQTALRFIRGTVNISVKQFLNNLDLEMAPKVRKRVSKPKPTNIAVE